jgi:GNAT superfamily N-acetyltransferase
MARSETTILPLTANSEALRSAARWRHEAFLKADGFSVADSEAQLVKLATDPKGPETALIAFIDEEPAGVCLLVLHEIEPAHDLSPWLASLYVAPQFRGRGVARRLVRAIEDHARRNSVARLHLYTVDAAEFYLKCGWAVVERFVSKDIEFALMTRDL